jgi:GTP cyclohydrolase II
MSKPKKLLEKLRTSHGLSQSEIADRLDLSRPTYSLIEKEQKELTLSQAKLLSDIYGVPVEAIRTGQINEKDFLKNEIVTTLLPTKFGTFIFGVWNQPKGQEVVFLQTPNLELNKPVLVRVHSECMTGEVFHSYRCDCGEQKDRSLEMIAKSGNGIFIYLRQEGRGIGLYDKIRAYILQDNGYDTHEANILLGHKPDYREYSWVKKVLEHLNIQQIKLITNNPSKVTEISRLGIKITERIPLVTESNSYNRKYFETKKQKFKHFFGKDESNYFYQFSYADSPKQVEEIGVFLSGKQKDPFLKICIGVYADFHTLNDDAALRNIESIFKSAEHYEGFVPILHFTFKFSSDPKKDIAAIRTKMPFVKYLRLNDLTSDHSDVLAYANKFFLVDIPISDENMALIDDPAFVKEVLKNKTFIMLDNSHGQGKQDNAKNVMKKVNKLLSVGINDIALCGGFGPENLDLYFDMCEHYRFNFSIDAETKLKTNGSIDISKVKDYLNQLINHKHDYQS